MRALLIDHRYLVGCIEHHGGGELAWLGLEELHIFVVCVVSYTVCVAD